jgi:putative methionine-R-sulfoxide reductase with GAF domain
VKRYRSAQDVLADVERALSTSRPGKDSPFDSVLDILYEGRHYFWAGIYLVVGREVRRQAFRGPVPPCHTFAFGKGNVGTTGETGMTKVIADVSQDPTYSMCFLETKSEIVVPIKIASRTLGVIDVEGDKPNAFGGKDRVLLERVATLLAKFLTSKGKYLARKAREADSRAGKTASKEKHAPASEKMQSTRRAAAGEASRP